MAGSGGQESSGGTSSGGTGSDSGGTSSGGNDSTGGADAGSGGSAGGCLPATVQGEDLDDLSVPSDAYEVIEGTWRFFEGIHGDGEDMYVLQRDTLHVLHGDDPTAELISDEIVDIGSAGGGGRLKIAGDYVYYATEHGVSRVPKAGGAVEAIYVGPEEETTEYIEVAGEVVFFGRVSGVGVWSVPAAGGDATQVSDTISPTGFASQGDALYVSDVVANVVMTIPAAGGDWTPASPYGDALGYFEGVATSADQVFWVDEGALKASPMGNPDQEMLLGWAPTGHIDVSGDRVYWHDDSIGWVKTDGSECARVYEADIFHSAWDSGVTPSYVYAGFSVGTDALIRIPVE